MAEIGESQGNLGAEHSSTADVPSLSVAMPLKSSLKTQMLCRLADTDAHFKHQQRGEPDLTKEEKQQIANEILEKSPTKFLEKFSKYLNLEDVAYFAETKDNFMVDYYLKQILARCQDGNKVVVKNRRYQALQKMMEEGEYFSQNEMKWRDPLLFEQMVGQYETQREKDKREVDMNDLKFSSILFKNMDGIANRELFDKMKENEESQVEEDEESSDDEEEMDNIEQSKNTDEDKLDEDSDDEYEAEKGHMKGEFLKIMQERFLTGQDGNFDYSTVDLNTDYDSLDIMGHDIEEKYFDDSDGDSMSQGSQGTLPCTTVAVEGQKSDNSSTEQQSSLCDRLTKESELDIRSGLKTMGLKESEEEDVEDYMNYEPSDDLIEKSKNCGAT